MIINEENSRASTFELVNWVRQRHLTEAVAGEHQAFLIFNNRLSYPESGVTYAELLNFMLPTW